MLVTVKIGMVGSQVKEFGMDSPNILEVLKIAEISPENKIIYLNGKEVNDLNTIISSDSTILLTKSEVKGGQH